MKKTIFTLIILLVLFQIALAQTLPPTNLALVASAPNWLYWEWDTPNEIDFNSSIVTIDGSTIYDIAPYTWTATTPEPDINITHNFFTLTDLTASTTHTIFVKAKYKDGSVSEEISLSSTTRPLRDRTPVCGNNVTETGEACDGYDVEGNACPTKGNFTGGALSCKTDCSGFDTLKCVVGKEINSNSCSYADVSDAINGASTGDIVIIPPGDCTWEQQLTISKGITLMGSGIDVTNITRINRGDDDGAIAIDTVNNQFIRITNMTIKLGNIITSNRSRVRGISANGTATQIRFDHLKIISLVNAGNCSRISGFVQGVIDHIEFFDCANNFRYFGLMSAGWQRPISIGSSNSIFFEDNNMTYSGTTDPGTIASGGQGARTVIRHNIVDFPFTNFPLGEIDAHGNQILVEGQTNLGQEDFTSGTGNHRAQVSIEIYDNNITIGNLLGRFVSIRGGTGVIYNNTFIGEKNQSTVHMWEEESNRFASWLHGYPANDQVNNYFVWNNTNNGVSSNVATWKDGDRFFIQENRDYFQRAPTQKEDAYYEYEPFTYPHPLTLIQGTGITQCNNNIDCDNSDPCTTNICDITNPNSDAQGCYSINTTSTCDDSNPCTLNDTCSLGTCSGIRNNTCVNIEEGLIAYYQFNKNALDSSPNLNNGSEVGFEGDEYSQNHGVFNEGVNFDGENYIKTNTLATDINPTQGSISIWVNSSTYEYSSSVMNGGLFGAGGSTSTDGLGITPSSSTSISLYYRENNSVRTAKIIDPPVNEWYHVVGTWDDKNLTIYLNGELSQTVAQGNIISEPLTQSKIGADFIGTLQKYFTGSIDELRVYDRKINETEINNLYNPPTLPQHPICEQYPGEHYNNQQLNAELQKWHRKELNLTNLIKKAKLWKHCN